MSESVIETVSVEQNISVEENVKQNDKKSNTLCSEVSTQSAVTPVQCPPNIPPNVMGHDINISVTGDVTGTGKRVLKPRLGVKVPYRNLTSQIVTQDEIAQEILERSLKKYTYQNFESSDLFFTMKLTNNFPSRIPSPSTATATATVASAAVSQSIKAESSQNESSPIMDNKELLAILDGSPDTSWEATSVGKKNVRQETKHTNLSSPYKFIKMYPELEKELALKQLEEFTKPRKKKEQTDTDEKQMGKNKFMQKRVKRIKGSENNNNNGDKKPDNNIKMVTKGKPGRKHKNNDQEQGIPKRKRVLKSTNGEIIPPTVADVSQITEVPTVEDGPLPSVPPVKDNRYIKKYVNKRLLSRSDEDPDPTENVSTVNGSLPSDYLVDNHTLVRNTENLSPKIKKTAQKKGDIVINNISKQKVNDVQEDSQSSGASSSGKRKQNRVMREIDKLLGDEGAINMLYSVEQKRTPGSTPNRRGILPSARRKKKDLLLKTRLVKNAVLRLSNSPPQSLGKTALRVRRNSNPSATPATTNPPKLETPQRKMSVESRDSLQSSSFNSPVHSPSFAYPTKLSVPAEASRIIRRHSSSSSYSSRSNSPRRPSIDADRSPVLPQCIPSSPEKICTIDSDSGIVNSVKKSTSNLKKLDETGVNKARQILNVNDSKTIANETSDRSERLVDIRHKDMKVENQGINKIIENEDDNTLVFKKDIHDLVKNRLSAEFSRTIKKNLIAAKLGKPKRNTVSDTVSEIQRNILRALSKQDGCDSIVTASSSSCHTEPSTSTLRNETSNSALSLNSNVASYSNLLKNINIDRQKKRDGEEKQRSSVRQNAGAYSYKEISLRRYDHLVQIILTPVSTKMKNAFNLQVFKEMTSALNCLRKDDTCRVVLFTSTGSAFCHGIDLPSLIHPTPEKRKTAAVELLLAMKNFIKSLATFNKPLIAGVHGAAVGLGVTMLPFFDMVFASDKATFHTPYARLGQIPEGAATLTLPQMLGNAVTSELLFGCRKLTASEALHFGLVTRILWPDRFQEELIPLIRGIATQSSQSMEATKALLRHSLCLKLDTALLSESQLLLKHWMSYECQNCFKQYLEEETPTLQK
ncbi:uncharacterized protein LOC142327096 [Lycorma delicatula]|uniref:uncharacterized protein LOC142327096 n=1 Tax=Lycorma delicatula TaxID=130591 RepID=UPI003F50DC3F